MGTLSVLYPTHVSLVDPGRATWSGSGLEFLNVGWSGLLTSVFGSTDEYLCQSMVADALGVAVDNDGSGYSSEIRLTFDQNTPIFILDGNPPISFNSLPSGFHITDLHLQLFGVGSGTPVGPVVLTIDGVSVPNDDIAPDYEWNFEFGERDPLDFIDIPIDIVASALGTGGGGDIPWLSVVWGLSMVGNYSIVSFQFTGTVEQPTEPVDEGETIDAESDPDAEHPVDYTQVLTVIATGPDGTEYPVLVFNAIDEFHFTFVIPSFGGDTPAYLTITITSTQFSGSVTLGVLYTIYFTSASGIYRLTAGKTNDTVYLEDDLPETLDVKIPNPFGFTGFIGG